MLLRYAILGFLAYSARLVFGDVQVSDAVVYTCAPKQPAVCYVQDVQLKQPNVEFGLENVGDKKMLNFKAGRIEALLPKHCQKLSRFTKVTIGRVGLKELCFATTFVEVNAQHNSIKRLHVDKDPADGGTYQVETVQLNDNQLTSTEGICYFVALKELHLERNFLSTLDMACFAQMAKLKKLSLAYNRLNTITTTISELQFPALEFIGLQNNTLIELDLHKWSLPALERLELSFNNLTNVRGLKNIETLSDISLAGNRWQCDELDQVLEALDSNGVTVKDGDQNCNPIRNGTICCKSEQLPSEATLLDELNKFSKLDQRYTEAENEFKNMIKQTIEQFESEISELQETYKKRKTPDEDKTLKKPAKFIDPTEPVKDDNFKKADDEPVELEDSTEPPKDDNLKKADDEPKCECTCSQESMDRLELTLKKLEENVVENNATLQTLLKNKSHFSYMTTLVKHEFRIAVERGEYKLKEVSSMLAMLRDHINNKVKQH